MVTGEVSSVLSQVTTTVQPLINFAMSAASSATGDADISQIQTLTTELTSTLENLLAPVDSLLSSLGLSL